MSHTLKNRGKEGEDEACAYLTGLGFAILERNWRHGKQELDIICKQGEELVFVEVKHRIDEEPVMARHAVSKAQQKQLGKAANAYIEHVNFTGHSRFDVIIITQMPQNRQQIDHYTEAFLPSNV